jgi:serine/threonine protein kinase
MSAEVSSVSSLLSALDSLGSDAEEAVGNNSARQVYDALSNSGSRRYGRSGSCSSSIETPALADSDWDWVETEGANLLSTTVPRHHQPNGVPHTSTFYARFIKDTQAQWDFYADMWRPDVLEPMNVDDVGDKSYEHQGVVGAGTYGVVAKMLDQRSKTTVAAKIFRKFDKDGATALSRVHRSFEHEVAMLLHIPPHRNIAPLHRLFVTDEILVILTPFYQTDLFHLRQQVSKAGGAVPWFTFAQIKGIMIQLLSALAHLHAAGVIHRDITSANIMYHQDGLIRLVDFGIARTCEQSIVPDQADLSLPRRRAYYTTGMTAMWFRAPELLFSHARGYDAAIDVWGAACVFGELLFRKVLLPGSNAVDQLFLVSFICGYQWASSFVPPGPDEATAAERRKTLQDAVARKCPDAVDSDVVDFLTDCLFVFDPTARWAAGRLVSHPFFTTSLPHPTPPADMPSFPDRSTTPSASYISEERRSSKTFGTSDGNPPSLVRTRRVESEREREREGDTQSADDASTTGAGRKGRGREKERARGRKGRGRALDRLAVGTSDGEEGSGTGGESGSEVETPRRLRGAFTPRHPDAPSPGRSRRRRPRRGSQSAVDTLVAEARAENRALGRSK